MPETPDGGWRLDEDAAMRRELADAEITYLDADGEPTERADAVEAVIVFTDGREERIRLT